MNNLMRCAHCKRLFCPNPRVKNQRYCGLPVCRRARKAIWQRDKMKTDPDYQDNQRRCQKQWAEAHRQYWREYRRTHTEYVLRNRVLQKGRDHVRRLAKMDALTQKIFLIPMPYTDLAKKDSIAFGHSQG